MTCAFELQDSRNGHITDEYDSNSDIESMFDSSKRSALVEAKLLIRHRFDNADVKRTILEFGWCFCSGSVAGGSLRNDISIPICMEVKQALEKFSNCEHIETRNGEGSSTLVCEDYLYNLNSAAIGSECLLSSAARLCHALVDSATYGDMNGLREVSLAASNVLVQTMNARHSFLNHFDQHAGDNVKSYNIAHRNGNGLAGQRTMN